MEDTTERPASAVVEAGVVLCTIRTMAWAYDVEYSPWYSLELGLGLGLIVTTTLGRLVRGV